LIGFRALEDQSMPVEIIFVGEVLPIAPPSESEEGPPDFRAIGGRPNDSKVPEASPEPKGLVTIEERLAFAYPIGAPAELMGWARR
jgi:hypothetical protein